MRRVRFGKRGINDLINSRRYKNNPQNLQKMKLTEKLNSNTVG